MLKKTIIIFILFCQSSFAESIDQCNQLLGYLKGEKLIPMQLDNDTTFSKASCAEITGGAKLIYKYEVSENIELLTEHQLNTLIADQQKYWCKNIDRQVLIYKYDIEYKYFKKNNEFLGKTYISKNDCNDDEFFEKISKKTGAESKNIEKERQKLDEEHKRLEDDARKREQAIKTERQQLAEERKKLEEERSRRSKSTQSKRIDLQVTNTQPDTNGVFSISIRTNSDTASLKINEEEIGGSADGNYVIKKVARAGQETKFTIVAVDINGNANSKTILVTRQIIVPEFIKYAELNPVQIKKRTERDAVAIIIGIASYKTLPKAEFANDDARVFYDYAIRALGVKPENIKLLVDQDADDVEIIKAFKTWLPSRVKPTTDVYVFYSGHGLPTQDGQGLYLLPPRTDRDFISRTAIQFQEINADLQAAKPKSVTIFMDACYSGQARSGETLVANARPVTLKAEKKLFPDNFTVITASQADQISSSSPDLKHGIFSYYLMKGMEGEADANKDGKITLGEMQAYLVENVGRQAGMMSRKQEPQLLGDVGRVLVGR